MHDEHIPCSAATSGIANSSFGFNFMEGGILGISSAKVGVAEMGYTEVGCAEVGCAEVGPAEVGVEEHGPTEIGSVEDSPTKVGPTEIGSIEVGLTQIWLYSCILLPPLLPKLYSLLEYIEMDLVCHKVFLLVFLSSSRMGNY
jgi:hypothetical protein